MTDLHSTRRSGAIPASFEDPIVAASQFESMYEDGASHGRDSCYSRRPHRRCFDKHPTFRSKQGADHVIYDSAMVDVYTLMLLGIRSKIQRTLCYKGLSTASMHDPRIRQAPLAGSWSFLPKTNQN